MLTFLKEHPFAVESFFETSLVLTYAIPKDELISRIPPSLFLDTFDDKWAFVAVALVKTRGLRPRGFPEFLGNDFVLAGYRIFVKYITSQGKRLRGLYILKSETNKKSMAMMGNVFTHYNYQKTDINFIRTERSIRVTSSGSDLDVDVMAGEEDIPLPLGSPFADWKQARRYAGPLPFTFTYDSAKKEMLIIEGVRQNWTPKPVEVRASKVGFIDGLGVSQAILANAFVITDIPYYWKKGRKDPWIPTLSENHSRE